MHSFSLSFLSLSKYDVNYQFVPIFNDLYQVGDVPNYVPNFKRVFLCTFRLKSRCKASFVVVSQNRVV
ncbi:hypothetical protein VCRA2120E8_160011 [Vibrio crassostreae]|nr:hypothetical protein VCRA2120E8_160011 [Vibrio crassostreae]